MQTYNIDTELIVLIILHILKASGGGVTNWLNQGYYR